jgi:hypothetical protein
VLPVKEFVTTNTLPIPAKAAALLPNADRCSALRRCSVEIDHTLGGAAWSRTLQRGENLFAAIAGFAKGLL